MSELIRIAAVIAIVAYVLGRQLIGEPLRRKRVVVLPIVLTVIGASDLSGEHLHARPVDIVCLLISGLIAAGLGIAQGSVMRLQLRDGGLWGQLPAKGLWLWLALVLSRVMLTLIAVGLDAKLAESGATILLMLGINRLGQAAAIFLRATNAGIPFAPEQDSRRADRRHPAH